MRGHILGACSLHKHLGSSKRANLWVGGRWIAQVSLEKPACLLYLILHKQPYREGLFAEPALPQVKEIMAAS